MRYQQQNASRVHKVYKNKTQQVDEIKAIIRQHKYSDTLRIFNECAANGLSVSFNALAKFARKLEQADNPQRQNNDAGSSIQDILASDTSPAEKVRVLFALKEERELAVNDVVPSTDSKLIAKAPTSKLQAARNKERELVAELGELRMQEHRILKEINLIRSTIKGLS